MGVPTSEVGYTSAMSRREDQEVHKDMWGHWGEKIMIHLQAVYKKKDLCVCVKLGFVPTKYIFLGVGGSNIYYTTR